MLLAVLLLGVSTNAQQQNIENINFQLVKADITGLQQITREKFLELSGLQLNQMLTVAQLKEAANKALFSGLFDKVLYRYSWDGDKLSVIFEVIERPQQPERRPPPKPEPKTETAKPLLLGKVQFTGLQRCDEATALKATGLQLGSVFDSKTLTPAAQALSKTGYFTEITYSFEQVDSQAVVNFNLIEFKWEIPCTFDNFVWFTKQEITDAVRKEISWFDGTAVENDRVPERIRQALSDLLRTRGIARQAAFQIHAGDMTDDDPTKIKKEFLFLAVGSPLPICQISFPQASPQLEKLLQNGIKPLLNVDYSSFQVSQYMRETLVPIYREKGFLRAKFGELVASPNSGENKKCAGGVTLSIPIEEGVPYKLGKLELSGNQALAPKEMQEILGLKPGATADGAKIDRGLRALREAYFNQGYLRANLNVVTIFDEADNIASYRISITEGSVFRFNELIVKNASESEEKRIRSKWQAPMGVPFNLSYARKFVQKFFEETRGSGRTPRVQMTTDQQKLTVDLIFTY